MKPNFGKTTSRSLLVLDFDTECRPLHYSEWRPESQITAYAWSWLGDHVVASSVLEHRNDAGQFHRLERKLLLEFMEHFNDADMVTGHYLLRHDLPLLVDHCIRLGVPLPDSKLVSDTKVHMPSVRALGLSQDNLANLLRLDEKKHHMSGRQWAEANVLTNQGRELTRKRVADDVTQHKAIRAELQEMGVLGAAQVWRP